MKILGTLIFTLLAMSFLGQNSVSRGEVGSEGANTSSPTHKPAQKVTKSVQQKVYFKTATKVGEKAKIEEVKYKVHADLSTLDNYLSLIEYKTKVDAKGTDKAKTSEEYQNLKAEIVNLKSRFYTEVETTGIKAVSKREQSYYLSMLKEDGDVSAYQAAINSLK